MKNYKYQEILDNLRKIHTSTERVKVQGVQLSLNPPKAFFTVISSVALEQEIVKKMELVLAGFMPDSFKNIEVECKKVKADEELVKSVLLSKFSTSYKYLTVKQNDVSVRKTLNNFNVSIYLQPSQKTLFTTNRVDRQLIDFLDGEFCEDFLIEVKDKEETPIFDEEEEADIADFATIPKRTLTVTEINSYVSYDYCDTAVYIADAINSRGEVYVCGIITDVREMQTKNGKVMFLIDFTDKSARLTGKMFPTEKKVQAVRLLKEGDNVIFKGEMGEYNGKADFNIKGIGLCKFPENFVPERRAGKIIAGKYKRVFPCEVEDVTQLDMFTSADYVEGCLIGKTFTVLDIETTGTNPSVDKITEVGAVRVVDGKIVDGFSTLINPQIPIPKNIIELTGITDEMVADKPIFSEIVDDLCKYIDGTVLVAHNASFDVGFIKRAAEKEGYYVENLYYDTLDIAKKTVLGLKNYKLNTICDHFGIQFLHHRAMSDAHATAKMFLELIKLKKCLPN